MHFQIIALPDDTGNTGDSGSSGTIGKDNDTLPIWFYYIGLLNDLLYD